MVKGEKKKENTSGVSCSASLPAKQGTQHLAAAAATYTQDWMGCEVWAHQ